MVWSCCCCSCSAKMVTFFSGPLSFPFTLPNFLPFIQAFICYPFHPSIHPIPARGWVGVLVFRCRVVYSACVRATVSFGSVRSRLLGFPISHLWTTCDVFLSWKLTHNSDTDPQMAKLIPFCIFKKSYFIVFRFRFTLEVEIFLFLGQIFLLLAKKKMIFFLCFLI